MSSRFRPLAVVRVFLQAARCVREAVVEFWASSETYKQAGDASEAVRRVTEPLLQHQFTKSRFATVQLLLRYIPIIMPMELLDRYPARSKARIKQRVLDCAPQLHYETFVSGSFNERVDAYVSGIRVASPLLTKFGVSPAEVEDFEQLLEGVKTATRAMSV